MIWEKSQIFHRITILESGILRSKPKGKEVKIMPFSSLWEDNVLQSTSKNFQHFPTLDICHQFSSVQSLSRVRFFATPWIAAHQDSLSITNSQSSLRLTTIESVMPSSHLILCRPLLLLSPNPSQHQSLFQWVNSWHEVAKVLQFQPWHHSFQRTHRTDLLQNGLVGSPCSLRVSRVFSNTTVRKH